MKNFKLRENWSKLYEIIKVMNLIIQYNEQILSHLTIITKQQVVVEVTASHGEVEQSIAIQK